MIFPLIFRSDTRFGFLNEHHDPSYHCNSHFMQRSLSETVDNVRLDSGLQKCWIVNVNLKSTEAWATCRQKLTMASWAVEAAQWRRLSPWWPLWWLPSASSLLCHHRFIIVGIICHNALRWCHCLCWLIDTLETPQQYTKHDVNPPSNQLRINFFMILALDLNPKLSSTWYVFLPGH